MHTSWQWRCGSFQIRYYIKETLQRIVSQLWARGYRGNFNVSEVYYLHYESHLAVRITSVINIDFAALEPFFFFLMSPQPKTHASLLFGAIGCPANNKGTEIKSGYKSSSLMFMIICLSSWYDFIILL